MICAVFRSPGGATACSTNQNGNRAVDSRGRACGGDKLSSTKSRRRRSPPAATASSLSVGRVCPSAPLSFAQRRDEDIAPYLGEKWVLAPSLSKPRAHAVDGAIGRLDDDLRQTIAVEVGNGGQR